MASNVDTEALRRKKGWLEKEAAGVGRTKRRWMVLSATRCEIEYFESQSSSKSKGSIDLREVTRVQQASKALTFELVTKQRTWVLRAESESEMLEWMAAIRLVMESADFDVSSSAKRYTIGLLLRLDRLEARQGLGGGSQAMDKVTFGAFHNATSPSQAQQLQEPELLALIPGASGPGQSGSAKAATSVDERNPGLFRFDANAATKSGSRKPGKGKKSSSKPGVSESTTSKSRRTIEAYRSSFLFRGENPFADVEVAVPSRLQSGSTSAAVGKASISSAGERSQPERRESPQRRSGSPSKKPHHSGSPSKASSGSFRHKGELTPSKSSTGRRKNRRGSSKVISSGTRGKPRKPKSSTEQHDE